MALNPTLAKPVWLFEAGLAASALLVILILVRYPGDDSSTSHLASGLLALLLIVAAAALLAWRGSRIPSPEQRADQKLGLIIGLLAGCLWILEISFNNFVDPSVSTAASRFYVDNGAWAIITLAILVASFIRAFQCRQILAGIRVGLWSGFTSGLIACLAALLLITFGMSFLLRDPLNVNEYATRSLTERLPDRATFSAYEVLAGAIGHLVVLGIVMGAIVGAIAGLLARLVLAARTRF